MMYRLLLSGFLVVLLLSGCATALHPAVQEGPATPVATPQAAAATELPAAVTASANRPVPTAVSAMSTAQPWDDWDVYLSALRPEAKPAADQLQGMTQYRLDLRLASDLSRLLGRMDVRYTNREQTSLDEVYFHLFPNLWDDGMTVGPRRWQASP
jgi:hypothetical protein